MDLLKSGINDYLVRVLSNSPSPLDEMERYARQKDFPIIGPLVGRILQQLAVLTKAKRIFELGSGYGYSALWMAMALPPDGIVVCTDNNPDNEPLAKNYFKQAGQESKLDFRVGDALNMFVKEQGPIDLVLNDIDKERYPDTIALVKERLRAGGVFVTDNLLWSGRVLESSPDETTLGILRFTEELCNDSDFITSIIPIRDGISIAVKR